MEAQERRGLEDDAGTNQPPRTHEERADAGDEAISEVKIGSTPPRAIQNQQLVFEEDGFRNHRPRAAWTGDAGDSRHEVEQEDNQIAHRHES
jgi:hypothetical protein